MSFNSKTYQPHIAIFAIFSYNSDEYITFVNINLTAHTGCGGIDYTFKPTTDSTSCFKLCTLPLITASHAINSAFTTLFWETCFGRAVGLVCTAVNCCIRSTSSTSGAPEAVVCH